MNEEPYKICLRLNADEAQKLIVNAKACGLTRTAYLRRLLSGYDLKPRPSAALDALRTEIHQIGNNINQIARKANAGFATREETTRALRMMDEVYGLLYEVAKRSWQLQRFCTGTAACGRRLITSRILLKQMKTC